MQQLFPRPGQGTREGPYAGLTLPPRGTDRPWWVALSMVSSLDGAASLRGRSSGLGGEADRRALARLRDAADAVLVGAATVREEGYGPLVGGPDRREDRIARGLAPVPRLAILTRSGDLDPGAAVFRHPRQRPLVLTSTDTAATVRERLGAVADVVATDGDHVDPEHALAHLAGVGLARVLCEGGPSVNAQLLAAGLVDEAFVTLAPAAVGGSAPRIARGAVPERLRPLRLETVWEHGGELLLRYRDPRHPAL